MPVRRGLSLAIFIQREMAGQRTDRLTRVSYLCHPRASLSVHALDS